MGYYGQSSASKVFCQEECDLHVDAFFFLLLWTGVILMFNKMHFITPFSLFIGQQIFVTPEFMVYSALYILDITSFLPVNAVLSSSRSDFFFPFHHYWEVYCHIRLLPHLLSCLYSSASYPCLSFSRPLLYQICISLSCILVLVINIPFCRE